MSAASPLGPASTRPGRVRAALANLRREPAHASELVSQLVLGEEAWVLEERAGWARVAGVDGYAGWTDAPVGEAAAANATELVWSRRGGLLREGPEPDAAPLLDLTLGARAFSGEGGAVRLPGGDEGWADAGGWLDAASLARRFPARGEAVAATGLSLRGVPYLWGGTSSKAFDCSGFVQRVFGVHGRRLPRDAWQQAETGVPAEPGPGGAELAAGDLLFFSERGGRVTHVALALGRQGRFVHSSTRRGGVAVDSLDPADPLHAPLLAATLVGSRRVL